MANVADSLYMVETVLAEVERVPLLREYSGRLDQELATQILSGEKNRNPANFTLAPVKIGYKTYFQ